MTKLLNWIPQHLNKLDSDHCPSCGQWNNESEIVKSYNQGKYSHCCAGCGRKY
jgi:hypothetical protein